MSRGLGLDMRAAMTGNPDAQRRMFANFGKTDISVDGEVPVLISKYDDVIKDASCRLKGEEVFIPRKKVTFDSDDEFNEKMRLASLKG